MEMEILKQDTLKSKHAEKMQICTSCQQFIHGQNIQYTVCGTINKIYI